MHAGPAAHNQIMATSEVKTACPATKIGSKVAKVSVGETLACLKKEQGFIGPILYTQLASSFTASASSAGNQTTDQKTALAAVTGFAQNAKNFRDVLSDSRAGSSISTEALNSERQNAVVTLKNDILTSTQPFKKVVYSHAVTTDLASTLGVLYRKNSERYLSRLTSREEEFGKKAWN